MISSGTNLVMTVIGFAVSAMFIVFVCTRLVCARIQLRNSRRSFPTASRSDLSVLERGLHGLEPSVVATFPTRKFGEQLSSPRRDTQCTICLAEYREKDVLRVLPYCGHAFHNDCIGIWLRQHSTCPVCRILLRESPDRKRMMQPVHSSAIRSLYPPQMGLDAYRSLHAGDAYLVRATDRRRESIQENQFISEPSGSREMVSTDITCYAKNSSPHASEVKYMESPSNA